MGIRFLCPNGHKLNVKTFLAGKRAICPQCGAKVLVPDASDSPTAEMPLPTGEIVANPGTASIPRSPLLDTASPSIIIAVAKDEVAAPTFPEEQVVVANDSPAGVLDIPGSVAAILSHSVDPAIVSTEDQSELRRARIRHRQMAISVVLLMLVIVLAFALVWVLWRGANPPAIEKSKAASGQEHATPVHIAALPGRFFYSANQGILRQ